MLPVCKRFQAISELMLSTKALGSGCYTWESLVARKTVQWVGGRGLAISGRCLK